MTIDKSELAALLASVASTRDDELGCDDALAGFAARAEQQLRGEPPNADTASIVRHLDDCPECAEEYAAVVVAIGGPDHADPAGP